MTNDAYNLMLPQQRSTSVVFASPHSGREYTKAFRKRSVLDEIALRSSEDAFLDHIFKGVTDHGAPFLAARFPRAYIDLNRSTEELDPAVVEGAPKIRYNPRVASGLGVIPRVVSQGRLIYRGKLGLSEARLRIADCWRPYHDCLQQLLNANRMRFGEALLIDCHSMPHEALDIVERRGGQKPDIVLGDRYGAAARSDLVDMVESIFVSAGLRVVRNSPFAGAFIAQHYGRPSSNQHVVQIEIDRSLYMNEALIQPSENFADFKKLMQKVSGEIAEIGRSQPMPLAAE